MIRFELQIKKENEKMKKQKVEKLDISSTWENILPQYARLYSSLNEDGKKLVLKRLSVIGKTLDHFQRAYNKGFKNE